MVRRHPRLPVPARDQDVADLAVALEVEEPIAIHPEHRLDRLHVHRRRRVVVAGGLDDQLARAARGDRVEHAHALAHQLPLGPEIRVRLGHDAHRPVGSVGRRVLLAVRGDLGARQMLGAGTVRARRLRG